MSPLSPPGSVKRHNVATTMRVKVRGGGGFGEDCGRRGGLEMLKRAGDQEKAEGNFFFCSSSSTWRSGVGDGRGKGWVG